MTPLLSIQIVITYEHGLQIFKFIFPIRFLQISDCFCDNFWNLGTRLNLLFLSLMNRLHYCI